MLLVVSATTSTLPQCAQCLHLIKYQLPHTVMSVPWIRQVTFVCRFHLVACQLRYNLPDHPLNRIQHLLNTLLCLSVFCLSMLIAFNLLNIDFKGQSSNTPWALSISLGKFESLAGFGAPSIALLTVGVVFTVVLTATASIRTAVSIFAIAALALIATYSLTKSTVAEPSLFAAEAVIASVFLCFLLCRYVQRVLHRRKVRHFYHLKPSVIRVNLLYCFVISNALPVFLKTYHRIDSKTG